MIENVKKSKREPYSWWIYLYCFGAFFTVAGVYTLASTVGVLGVLLFVIGMSLKSNIGMSETEVRNWRPDEGQLPDAGRGHVQS